jgi:hypothetical protein
MLLRALTSCPPLLDHESPWMGPEAEGCRTFDREVARQIVELRTRGLVGVVLAARWSYHFGQPPANPLEEGLFRNSAARIDPTRQRAKIVESLDHTLARLGTLGLRVLVIGPSPEFPYAVPACLFHRSMTGCALPRKAFDEQRLGIAAELRQVISRHSQARYFDPAEALCDAEVCPAMRDDLVLYADDDHLTASAAASLEPAARPMLRWVAASEATVARPPD